MSRTVKEPKTLGEAFANLFSAENHDEKQLAQKEYEQIKLNLVDNTQSIGISLSFNERG